MAGQPSPPMLWAPCVSSHSPALGKARPRSRPCTNASTLPATARTSAASVATVVAELALTSNAARCTTPRNGAAAGNCPSSCCQSAADAMRDFGLIGTWAATCAEGASPSNNHATYLVTAAGASQLRYQSGADFEDSVYDIREAKLLAPDRLWLRQILTSNERVILDIVLVKENDKIRICILGAGHDGSRARGCIRQYPRCGSRRRVCPQPQR